MQTARTRTPYVWFFIASISFAIVLAMPYLEGRSNSIWIVPPLLPANIVPVLALLVSLIALARCWIRSFLLKRNTFAVGMMLFLAVAMFGINLMVPDFNLFQIGLRDYAKSALTADEWRSIARLAQTRLGPEGRLSGPGKNLWDEKADRALWSDLCTTTRIQKLDPSLMIFVHPDETEIIWGGALTGHRGVIIYTGKVRDEQRDKSSQTMLIADDIATFITP